MDGLPAREGARVDTRPAEAERPYDAQRLTHAESLQTLTEEFVLFTTALLFSHGGWDCDPVADYVRDHPACRVGRLELPQAVFEGLEVGADVGWDYRLLLCPKERWQGLWRFLAGLGGVDFGRGCLHRVLAQVIPIPDVLALERCASLPTPVPMVQVFVWGIDGDQRLIALVPAASPPVDRARPQTYPPDPKTVQLARELLPRCRELVDRRPGGGHR